MTVTVRANADVLQLVVTHLNQYVHCYLLLVENVLQTGEPNVVEEFHDAEVFEANDDAVRLRNESLLASVAQLATTDGRPTKRTLDVLLQPATADVHTNTLQLKTIAQ